MLPDIRTLSATARDAACPALSMRYVPHGLVLHARPEHARLDVRHRAAGDERGADHGTRFDTDSHRWRLAAAIASSVRRTSQPAAAQRTKRRAARAACRVAGERDGIAEWNARRSGRGGGIRTHDPLPPRQMRYQAALRPDRYLCDRPDRRSKSKSSHPWTAA